MTLSEHRRQAEQQAIQSAADRHKGYGGIAQIAKELGVHRNTVHRKFKEFGIPYRPAVRRKNRPSPSESPKTVNRILRASEALGRMKR